MRAILAADFEKSNSKEKRVLFSEDKAAKMFNFGGFKPTDPFLWPSGTFGKKKVKAPTDRFHPSPPASRNALPIRYALELAGN